jgi:hypothetical protein
MTSALIAIGGLLRRIGWSILMSALWLSLCAAGAATLLAAAFTFESWRPAAWRELYQLFLTGGTLRFDFVAALFATCLLALVGEILLLLHWPTLLVWLPELPAPRAPRWQAPRRAPIVERPRPASVPLVPPAAPKAPPVDLPDSAGQSGLARVLSLFDVWKEPPATWMLDAMHDEIAHLPPHSWSRLAEIPESGPSLIAVLRRHGLLPGETTSSPALAVPDAPIPPPETATPGDAGAPALTLGAAWLCELLDHFALQTGALGLAPPLPAPVATLVGRAIRGMKDQDWASLDRFPERASRIRVLSDRLREQLRAIDRSPGHEVGMVDALLRQFGFDGVDVVALLGAAPLLTRLGALRMLLQLVDLQERNWQLPHGVLGAWRQQDRAESDSPCRVLWQRLSLLRLHYPQDPLPVGLVIVTRGRLLDEGALAQMTSEQVARTGIRLCWLTDADRILPDLRRCLGALSAAKVAAHQTEPASRRAAVSP